MNRGLGVREFALRAPRVLARAVPFDGVCVLTMDPATHLPTGDVVENGLPAAATPGMAEIELRSGLQHVRRRSPAREPAARPERGDRRATSTAAGATASSAPHGLGDELRAALVERCARRGAALTLLRDRGAADFAPADTSARGRSQRDLAEGLRRAILFSDACASATPSEGTGGLACSPPTAPSLADPPPSIGWPSCDGDAGGGAPVGGVAAVAGRAAASRRAARRRAPSPARESARPTGRWLVLRGPTLGDGRTRHDRRRLEPARPHELAPLIADAYGLTERERAVTQLVAQRAGDRRDRRASCTCRPGPCRTT